MDLYILGPGIEIQIKMPSEAHLSSAVNSQRSPAPSWLSWLSSLSSSSSSSSRVLKFYLVVVDVLRTFIWMCLRGARTNPRTADYVSVDKTWWTIGLGGPHCQKAAVNSQLFAQRQASRNRSALGHRWDNGFTKLFHKKDKGIPATENLCCGLDY